MSLGLVVLEEKLFTCTRTPTPQSDDIKGLDTPAMLCAALSSMAKAIDGGVEALFVQIVKCN